jgi:arabinofuranosyltransferase
MHGRLLLPATMMVLLPVLLFPVTRRRFELSLACLTAAGLWAALCMSDLRVDYPAATGISDNGVADERAYYVRASGNPHPVTLPDHATPVIEPYTHRVRLLAGEGEDVIVAQRWAVTADSPVAELGRSGDGGVVFMVGNAGFYGVAAGTDVTVVDFFGLSDPLGSHMAAPPPGRPGHEKQIPLAYFVARYGTGSATSVPTADIGVLPPYAPVVAGQVEAARDVLQCGEVAELLAATDGELTWGRFWDNLTGSVERTNMRVPHDAEEARDEFC